MSGPQGPFEPQVRPAHPIDPGVTVGHVHLRTADIDRVREFYVGVWASTCLRGARRPRLGHHRRHPVPRGRRLSPPSRLQHVEVGRRPPQPDGVAGLHHVALPLSDARRPGRALRRLRAVDWPLRQRPTTAPTRRSTSPTPTATTWSSLGPRRSTLAALRHRRGAGDRRSARSPRAAGGRARRALIGRFDQLFTDRTARGGGGGAGGGGGSGGRGGGRGNRGSPRGESGGGPTKVESVVE